MSVTIDLAPDIEAGLATRAAGAGVPLAAYLRRMIENATASPSAPLSPAERAELWRSSAKLLPQTAPLPDAAISRESFYHERG